MVRACVLYTHYLGSIPSGRTIFNGPVAKLVKAADLKSAGEIFVGSTPTSVTSRSRGQTARRQPDMLETMVQLHPGLLR